MLLVWQTSRPAYVVTDAHVVATTTHATRMQPTQQPKVAALTRHERTDRYCGSGRPGKEQAGINNTTVREEAEVFKDSTRTIQVAPVLEANSVTMNQSDRLQCYMLTVVTSYI